jgi:predicted nucleic acid-binding protein
VSVTAVDANVLIDVLVRDQAFWKDSYEALELASARGSVIVAPIVVAEVAGAATRTLDARTRFDVGDDMIVEMDAAQLVQAGLAWRQRVLPRSRRSLPDYLIAVHAARNADRLLTRDKDFTKLGVAGLEVVTPQEFLAAG